LGAAETTSAVGAAAAALPACRARIAKDRAAILKRRRGLILENADELARLTTAVRKPLGEVRGDVLYSARFVEWFAEEARSVYGDTIPSNADMRLMVIKQPVEVVAAVTPWNFPAAMIARNLDPRSRSVARRC